MLPVMQEGPPSPPFEGGLMEVEDAGAAPPQEEVTMVG